MQQTNPMEAVQKHQASPTRKAAVLALASVSARCIVCSVRLADTSVFSSVNIVLHECGNVIAIFFPDILVFAELAQLADHGR